MNHMLPYPAMMVEHLPMHSQMLLDKVYVLNWLTCRPTVDNKSKSACNLILDVLPIGMGYPILLAVDPMFRKKDHPSYIPDPYWIPMQYIDTAELESAYIIEHLDNEPDMLHWKI